jgi:lysophospholipase L1-like esterase
LRGLDVLGTPTSGGAAYSGTFGPPATGALRVMTIGDSITQGYPATDGIGSAVSPSEAGGYRSEEDAKLTNLGISHSMVGTQTNNPTAQLLNSNNFFQNGNGGTIEGGGTPYIANEMAATNPNVIQILYGINDLRGGETPSQTFSAMQTLLNTIYTQNPNVTILLAGILSDNDGANSQDTNSNIQLYNSDLQGEVATLKNQGKSIYYVDMYDAFVTNGTENPGYYFDGVHPSASGYSVMGDMWATAIQQDVFAPEPASGAVLTVGAAILLARRRGKSAG